MHISELYINGVRNLATTKLSLHPKVNVFYGLNGSGKTSILEAVYLLSLGKSFRTNKFIQAINFNQQQCSIAGTIIKPDLSVTLGCTKERSGRSTYKLVQEMLKSPIRLAKELPLQLMDHQSFALLDGGPEARRKYLDWGVFHVEQTFAELNSRFKRALKQRNTHIKQRIRGDNPWDAVFLASAQEIDRLRRDYLRQLLPKLQDEAQKLLGVENISIRYIPGWDNAEQTSLKRAMELSYHAEHKAGFSLVGPQKADLEVLIHGEKAVSLLSRGQLKTFIFAMLLARAKLLTESNKPIFLIDDLRAELDEYASNKILAALNDFGSQTLISGIELSQLERSIPSSEAHWFHVEHGKIAKLDRDKTINPEVVFHVEH